MKSLIRTFVLSLLLLGITGAALAAEEGSSTRSDYDVVTWGTRELFRADGSDFVKILVEAANLGGDEVEIAEITFAPNYTGGGHPHGSLEIFYVLSGELTHVVNGRGATLESGQVGIVRPGDTVEHINNTDDPVKTLVIWVPGGEIQRSFGNAQMQAIGSLPVEDFGEQRSQ